MQRLQYFRMISVNKPKLIWLAFQDLLGFIRKIDELILNELISLLFNLNILISHSFLYPLLTVSPSQLISLNLPYTVSIFIAPKTYVTLTTSFALLPEICCLCGFAEESYNHTRSSGLGTWDSVRRCCRSYIRKLHISLPYEIRNWRTSRSNLNTPYSWEIYIIIWKGTLKCPWKTEM